jgi:hypothetical protein
LTIESTWSCRLRNECSNHGSCVQNETCQCTNSYSGNTCDQCATNLFAYPTCAACPACVRGRALCNASIARCDCIDSARIYGSLCQYCHHGYYGDYCEAIPNVFWLSPTVGLELANDTQVTIAGDNFQNVTSFCVLDGENDTHWIPATVISSEQVSCIFPSHLAETVRVRLMHNGSIVTSETTLTYRYLPSCPVTGCGQGACVMGTCRCRYPYIGLNCTSLPVAPALFPIPNITLQEISQFDLNMSRYLLQGDRPLEWFLNEPIPRGLTIDAFSSTLTWTSAIASSESYPIAVNVRQSSTEATA